MQFLREEREKIYSQRKDKKKKSLHISHAHLPPPRNNTKKWHSLYKSTPPRRQKRRPPPRRRPRSRRCARVSFARVFFRPDSDFFFCLSPKRGVFFKGRKNATKKRTKKAQHSHLRVARIRPKNRPFDAVKRAHRTPKCTGSTSVRALTPQHPSRAGREEVLSSGKCVRKTKVERDLQSFFHRERSNAHPQLMGKKTRGRIERDFVGYRF